MSSAAQDAKIVGVGTAVSPFSYSQQELLDIFEIEAPQTRSLFLNSGIERRFLTLPKQEPGGRRRGETQGELLEKHHTQGLDMGTRALQSCVKAANADLDDIRHLCCVSSTGFLVPGFSAMFVGGLNLRLDCNRLDVVGMGCNAGLNALSTVASWCNTHPGELAVMLCIEVCSAAYVIDGTMRTNVVNSLFADGAAAVAVVTAPDDVQGGPTVVGFVSHLIPDAVDAMRYDWDDDQGKFSFFLDRDIPYVVGAHAELAVDRLLCGAGLRRDDITHWIVHSGGKKVIDAVMVNLGLTRHEVRHTIGVLRDYGNLSSGSFLFSYERLLQETVAQPGDYGVFMTMGPGSTIETALIRW
ncbi:MAG: 3,5-dihydroxyphenylacetyl-CoA synthase DpgA [Pseudonocardiales bacterium]